MNVSAAQKAESIVRTCRFAWTGDGTAAVLALGFNPQWIEVINITDTTQFEKIAGMAANATLKRTGAPAFSVDTTSAVVFNGDGTVTVSAAANITGKSFVAICG